MQPPFRRPRVLPACASALLACCALPSQTQVVSVKPSVDATVTVSDRIAVDAEGQGRSGVLVEARPQLAVSRHGARVTLDAVLGADAVAASVGEARTRVYPQLSAKAAAELVEHVLHLDAAADLRQEALSPLSRRTSGLGADRRLTTFAWRAGPRLHWEWRPGWLLLGDALAAGSRVVDGETADGERPSAFAQAQRLRLERLPLPVGGAIELSRRRSEDLRRDVEVLAVDSLRADLGHAFTDELVVYGIVGREEVELESGRRWDGGVHGARVLWRPGLRTLLDATAMHRFFGTGWTLQFRHRNPWLGFELRSRRDVSTPGGTGPGVLDAGTPAALLDSMLSTRHRDPLERRALVQDFAQQHPLLLAPATAYGVAGSRPQLERSIDASLLLVGRRNSASLSAYDRRLSTFEGGNAGPSGLLDSLRSERGVAAGWSHRLTPMQDLNLRYAQSRTRLAGAAGGTQERELLLAWSAKLQPRLRAHVGLKLAHHSPDQGPRETERAVFVGLSYAR